MDLRIYYILKHTKVDAEKKTQHDSSKVWITYQKW